MFHQFRIKKSNPSVWLPRLGQLSLVADRRKGMMKVWEFMEVNKNYNHRIRFEQF